MDEPAARGVKRSISNTDFPTRSPSPTRPKLRMLLETVTDTLSDADHSRLDAELFDVGQDSFTPVTTLATIANIQPRVAKALYDKHPGLKDLLKNAWDVGSFKSIRRLKILQPSSAATAGEVDRSRFVADCHKNAIPKAWETPYEGGYHKLLLNNINSMKRVGSYSNTVPIVQSSGSGKSRMVSEQSNLVFTIPFNLRNAAENKAFAYPPPDDDVALYLATPSSSFEEGLTGYRRFLATVFRAVADELATLPPVVDYADLAHAWHVHLETDRRSRRRQMYKRIADELKRASKTVPDVPAVLKALIHRIQSSCQTGYDDKRVMVMVYFDEAHELTSSHMHIPNDPFNRSMYDVMCSCMNDLLDFPIFAVFLSTYSFLTKPTPAGRYPGSGRARDSADHLQAPITETPFDCSPKFPIEPGGLTLASLSTVEFMARFGRPLFWTLLHGADAAGERLDAVDVIDLARTKLMHTQNLTQPLGNTSAYARLALLDLLINLTFNPHRQASRNMEAELIASHMRVAFSVPAHREYLRSGYPSEPILAEAALQQINILQAQEEKAPRGGRHQRAPNVLARILSENLKSGVLDPGHRDEVVMRVLLMTAYMGAVLAELPSLTPPNFSKGCRLTTFIKSLFRQEHADLILSSLPDNLKRAATFQDAFEDAIVRFTHFVKMADDSLTTSPALLAAFVRGSALIGWSSQRDLDLIIPVLLDPNQPLHVSRMSVCLVQIKRRAFSGKQVVYAIDQKALDVFPADASDTRPYVTLVAELGVPATVSPPAKIQAEIRQAPTHGPTNKKKRARAKSTALLPQPTLSKVTAPAQPEKISHPRDSHPRYGIFTYGCSDTVYEVINHNERDTYNFLLGQRDFLEEHPRSDSKSLSAVLQLKPFWRVGVASYNWIDLPFLHDHEVHEAFEGVSAGTFEDDEGASDEDEL